VQTKHECILIWWGGLEPHKGLALGLEALGQVRDSRVHLWVAGEGSMRVEWEDLARRLEIAERVRFFGRVSQERLRELACASDAFLFTSLRESFGSVVLQAMSVGLPVITLDHHGVSTFLSNNEGFKVPVTKPAETIRGLACAIESFAGMSGPARQRMAEAAWNKARGQRWSERVALALELYREALPVAKGQDVTAGGQGVQGGVFC
jgi:glycosyltransferase involved in cell wall biosynthesis